MVSKIQKSIKHVDRDSRLVRVLLLCGVLAPFLLIGSIIVAGLFMPEYSFTSSGISQLGSDYSPYATLINAVFITCGLLLLAFSYGVYRRLGGSAIAKATWCLLIVAAFGVVFSGIFQTDFQELGIRSLEGSLHFGASIVTFFALLTSMAVFGAAVHRKPAWHSFTHISSTVSGLNLALVLVLVAGFSDVIQGAIQFSFIGLSMIWYLAVALRSLRVPHLLSKLAKASSGLKPSLSMPVTAGKEAGRSQPQFE